MERKEKTLLKTTIKLVSAVLLEYLVCVLLYLLLQICKRKYMLYAYTIVQQYDFSCSFDIIFVIHLRPIKEREMSGSFICMHKDVKTV